MGGSISRNAAEGRGSLERLMLPVGPLHVYVEPGAARHLRVKVDAVAVAHTTWAAFRPELRLDWGRTLSAGTPTFQATTGWEIVSRSGGTGVANGLVLPGTILLSDGAPATGRDMERTFAHERVHVLQDDQIQLLWGDPLEEWILSKVPAGRWVGRWVDLDVALPVWAGLNSAIDYSDRPWELEAYQMDSR